MLLRLGPEAELKNPPELRERLANLVVDLTAIHRPPAVIETGHDQAAGCQGDMETWRGG